MPFITSDAQAPIAESSENPSLSTKTNSRESPIDSKSRTIVLCFDGTGNQFSKKVRRCAATTVAYPSLIRLISQNTNVVKLFSILKINNPDEQVCYYQASARPSTFFYSFYLAEHLTTAWYRDLHEAGRSLAHLPLVWPNS